jgi:ABC-type nickel/cobalt efflux system permease component RcnA
MSGNTPALLLAAAGVGFGHAILPDHWVPLAVLGRAQRYPISRVARLSGLAGIAHVLVSVLLGAIIIVVGLQFRSSVQSAQDAIVGGVLIATGIGFLALELSGRGHHHHDHEHGHGHDHPEGHDHSEDRDHGHDDPQPHAIERHGRGLRGLAAVMVPFGAAASPDLTILPVFLAATTAGVATALVSLAVFAAVTIGTIVGLTVSATRGAYEIRGEWLERWGNALTAGVLLVIGALVLTGVI